MSDTNVVPNAIDTRPSDFSTPEQLVAAVRTAIDTNGNVVSLLSMLEDLSRLASNAVTYEAQFVWTQENVAALVKQKSDYTKAKKIAEDFAALAQAAYEGVAAVRDVTQ